MDTNAIYKTNVMDSALKIGAMVGCTVGEVYDSSCMGLTPVAFTRRGGSVYLNYQPIGQVYVKYLKR